MATATRPRLLPPPPPEPAPVYGAFIGVAAPEDLA